jgi:hypothetical protein
MDVSFIDWNEEVQGKEYAAFQGSGAGINTSKVGSGVVGVRSSLNISSSGGGGAGGGISGVTSSQSLQKTNKKKPTNAPKNNMAAQLMAVLQTRSGYT